MMNWDDITQKYSRVKVSILFLCIVVSALLIYACESTTDGQSSGNSLQISLSCPDQSQISELAKSSEIVRDLEDIVLLRLTVEGGDPPIDPIVEEFDDRPGQ